MSYLLGHRNSNLSGLSNYNEPPGTIIKFQWSISAAGPSLLEYNSTRDSIPPIDTDRSQQKTSTNSSSSTHFGLHSTNHSPISSPRSSHLPSIAKKHHSPALTESVHSSIESSPLLLSYASMHPVLSPSPVKQSTQKSLSIHPNFDDKRKSFSIHSISNLQRKSISIYPTSDDKGRRVSILPIADDKRKSISIHSTSGDKRKSVSIQPIFDDKQNSTAVMPSKLSRRSTNTISPPITLPALSPKPERRLSNNNLVRLSTPQLRRLRVSEKYINEAKKLYFNAPCKSFIPRIAII